MYDLKNLKEILIKNVEFAQILKQTALKILDANQQLLS